MIQRFLKTFKRGALRIEQLSEQVRELRSELDLVRTALGRIEARLSASDPSPALHDHEFKVFSQWGEDGIIDHLIRNVRIDSKVFVEFGVETYREANTRFLLIKNRWQGLVIDGNGKDVARIQREAIYWMHNLRAVHAFITRENINSLLKENGVTGEIGLLSIDIDGCDYWVWAAIDAIQPVIVVVEYNAVFGPVRSVTVPYDPEFRREKAHYSYVYAGASLRALVKLGQKKGYVFLGTNQAGNNAFFVLRSHLPDGWRELSVEEGFTGAQFREARNERGELAYLSAEEAFRLISELPLVEV